MVLRVNLRRWFSLKYLFHILVMSVIVVVTGTMIIYYLDMDTLLLLRTPSYIDNSTRRDTINADVSSPGRLTMATSTMGDDIRGYPTPNSSRLSDITYPITGTANTTCQRPKIGEMRFRGITCMLPTRPRRENNKPYCKCVSAKRKTFTREFHILDDDVVKHNFPDIRPGGEWFPEHCIPREKVAIVIPYMKRAQHIPAITSVMHPFLRRQNIHYKIFIVEQSSGQIFNKGATYNAGFSEIMKQDNYSCVFLHDIDLLPQDDRIVYTCKLSPAHLSTKLDKFNYRYMIGGTTVGGVLGITPLQYTSINGYSNRYEGWGGEDDDFRLRIKGSGMLVTRSRFGCYIALQHERDVSFPQNGKRFKLLHDTRTRRVHPMDDGLNNVKYIVNHFQLRSLYTMISISLI